MDFYGRVEGGEFAGVGGEVGRGEVADVDGAGAVVGVVVGGRAADAEGGVGAGDDYHFVFYATTSRAGLCLSAKSVLFCDLVNLDVGGRVRSCGVPRYAADLGDVFEGAGVGGLDDELLAEGSEAGFGAGCHAGVCEGFDEPSVCVGGHCCRRRDRL